MDSEDLEMQPTSEHCVKRRRPNACTRCRQHKIKCSGNVPCESCARRKAVCDYGANEKNILVSKGYVTDLKSRIASLERQIHSGASPKTPTDTSKPRWPLEDVFHSSQGAASSSEIRDGIGDVEISNPISSPEYLTHVPGPEGTPHHLGHSSNYSFTQRILRLLHSRISQDPYPLSTWAPYGARKLSWDGQRTSVEIEVENLPSIDHAIHLINTVKFRAGQTYHLFDEDTFMPRLYDFYSDPLEKMEKMKIWYIHFLVLLAFGKAFTASKLLPEPNFLINDAYTSTEILCCMALYHQALDSRVLSYDKIGQAVRMGITAGMHTPMQPDIVNQGLIQRCRKIWWTTYLLDHQISAMQGLPVQVRDEDITAPLPVFFDSEQRTIAVEIHVELSRALVRVVSSVYRKEKNPDISFVYRAQEALRYVASVANGLHTHFPLPTLGSIHMISPITAHLNILYHHCILIATRPFLSLFLEKRLKSSENEVAELFWKDPIRHILRIGIESAKRTSTILGYLKEQHLIETFLAFLLECCFSTGTVITIGLAHLPSMFASDDMSLQNVIDTLQKMIWNGNSAAKDRLSELQLLMKMLDKTSGLNRSSQEPLESLHQQTGLSYGSPSMDAMNIISQEVRRDGPDVIGWVEQHSMNELSQTPLDLNTLVDTLSTWDPENWLSNPGFDYMPRARNWQ